MVDMTAPVRGIDPWAVQVAADGTTGITTDDARFTLGSLWAMSAPASTYAGVVPQGTDPDSKRPAGLIVTPSVPASMRVKVSPGQFVVQSNAAGTAYIGGFKSPTELDCPPSDATYDRADRVVAYVTDADAGLGTGYGSWLDVLRGPADGSQEPPTPPDGATVIASWTTPAGASAIDAINDIRTYAVATGGVRPIYGGIGVDDPGYPGQVRNVVSDDGFSMEFYSGTDDDWLPIITKRIPWSPQFVSDDGPVDLGDGGYVTAYYQRLVQGLYYIYVRMYLGTEPSAHTGDIRCGFPPGYTPASDQRILALARLPHTGVFHGQGSINVGAGNLTPVFPVSAADTRVSNLRSALPGQGPGTGIPYVANDWTVKAGFDLIMSGMVLAA